MIPQEHNLDRPQRKSTRLPTYDYASTGAYFVTICTDQRRPLLEQLELRQCLLETWQKLPNRFPGITLDEFVIMPDHVHFIIWLDSPAEHATLLSRIVGAYKSLTTVVWHKYHKARGTRCPQHLWQRGYYDHVIRHDQDLELTRQYIVDNPV
jgi:REP-associated tyrosine transposase